MTDFNAMRARNRYQKLKKVGDGSKRVEKKRKVAKIIMSDLTGYLRWNEVERVIEAAATMQNGDRNRMLIATLAFTGRRESEVLKMTPRAIQWDEGTAIFGILKKGTPIDLMFPLHRGLMEELQRYIERNGIKEDDYLFKGRTPTKHLSRQMLYVIVRKAGEIAGIPRVGKKWIHVHTFRHSFAIEYYRKTHDLNRLSQLLAHTDINVTKIYAQFSPGDERKSLDEM